MKKLLLASTLLLSFGSTAAELKVLKLDPARRIFALENKDLKKDQSILIYNKDKALTAVGKINGCKDTYCFGQVTKAKKGFALDNSLIFSSEKLEVKLIEAKEDVKKDEGLKQNLYAGVGGPPVSFGLRFGYNRFYNNEIYYGVTAGIVNAEVSSIEVTGNTFGALLGYKFKSFEKVDFFGEFELGMFNSELNFTLDDVAPVVSEGQYYYSFSGSMRYQINESFDLKGRFGYAINTFDESYENELGESYTVPFAGGMMFIEAGVSYWF